MSKIGFNHNLFLDLQKILAQLYNVSMWNFVVTSASLKKIEVSKYYF